MHQQVECNQTSKEKTEKDRDEGAVAMLNENSRQLACVFQDIEQPSFSFKTSSPRATKKNYNIENRESKSQSQSVIQRTNPH